MSSGILQPNLAEENKHAFPAVEAFYSGFFILFFFSFSARVCSIAEAGDFFKMKIKNIIYAGLRPSKAQ